MGDTRRLWDENEAREVGEALAHRRRGDAHGVVALAAAVWNPHALRVAERVRRESEWPACIDRVFAPARRPFASSCRVRRRLAAPVRPVYPPWRRDVRGYVVVCLGGSVRVDHGAPAGTVLFSPGRGAETRGEPYAQADGTEGAVCMLEAGQSVWLGPHEPHALLMGRDAVAVGLWLLAPGPALEAYRGAFRAGKHPQFRRTEIRAADVVETKKLERALAKTLQTKNR